MLNSMTAFAASKGALDGQSWAWELRSVNGKGLDLRLRVPDWIEGLETGLRARLGKAVTRGNVSLTLRVQSDERAGALTLNEAVLEDVLAAMAAIETRAMDRGLSLAPANAADILTLRGLLETGSGTQDTAALCKAMLADFEPVLEGFLQMRQAEGAALERVLSAQLDEIEGLTEQAAEVAVARKEDLSQSFRAALGRVMEAANGVDEGRVAQELAMMAVKLDVTEEIDRLRAHVGAARALLAEGSPMGRKLDFLSQEFNREANTLCSKAQNAGLTTIGLGLKTVIDQMREQVQNIE
ncbi:YicC/YloC family endoribonuclease [Roseovarius sp.]|uniref:YicC/YloC family endoribonuclease n=1 Tax=Roseovarius sp. TaxID=1486281 RepID=UPI0025DBE8E2|nr:YicC/YloC family endoribonuclease [Roseovarius sp.]